MLGPGDQVVKLQFQGLASLLLGQLLQLRAGAVELCGQRRGKAGVAIDARLFHQPGRDRLLRGKA